MFSSHRELCCRATNLPEGSKAGGIAPLAQISHDQTIRRLHDGQPRAAHVSLTSRRTCALFGMALSHDGFWFFFGFFFSFLDVPISSSEHLVTTFTSTSLARHTLRRGCYSFWVVWLEKGFFSPFF